MRSKALAKRHKNPEPITPPSRDHHSLTSRNPGRRTGSTPKLLFRAAGMGEARARACAAVSTEWCCAQAYALDPDRHARDARETGCGGGAKAEFVSPHHIAAANSRTDEDLRQRRSWLLPEFPVMRFKLANKFVSQFPNMNGEHTI